MAESLAKMECVACNSDEPKVTDAEVREYLPQLPDWQKVDEDGIPRLRKAYRFKNFAEALDFTNRVGEAAEHEDHHPAILTEWGRTTVTWWTHAISGLHRNDFIMAARTDELYTPPAD